VLIYHLPSLEDQRQVNKSSAVAATADRTACVSADFADLRLSPEIDQGTEWPFMCWCAVKKLLTHSFTGIAVVSMSIYVFTFSNWSLLLVSVSFFAVCG